MWYFYVIKTETDNYYVGITKNLDLRMKQHKAKYGADYTGRFHSLAIVYHESYKTRTEAEQREKQIKGWSRAKKQALINQDFSLLKKLSKNSGLVDG